MIEDTKDDQYFNYTVDVIVRPSYAINTKHRKENTAPIIVLFDKKQWPLRSLVQKNLNHDSVAYRKMSDKERVYHRKSYRVYYVSYRSWMGLIEDEIDVLGKDHPFIEQLRKLSKKEDFKHIPFYKMGKQTRLEL